MECRLRPEHPPHSRLLELEHPGGTQHPRYGELCPCPPVPHSAALLQGFPSSGGPNTSFSQPSRASSRSIQHFPKFRGAVNPRQLKGAWPRHRG